MDKIKDKSYKKYTRLSRYSTLPYYYNLVFNKYNYATGSYLDDGTTYELYLVKQGDTYDSISLQYYNRPDYFWIICNFNRINDSLEDPTPGTYLKIPAIGNLIFKEE